MTGKRTRIDCKDCGSPVFYADGTRTLDLARGLSAPERCPKCRKSNREHINSAGQSYWEPRVETDDSKRCWGQFGLGRLTREREAFHVEEYEGVPPQAPIWWLENPNDPRLTPEHAELASKFSKIAPATEQLLENLLDPAGKRVSILVGPTGTGKSTWVPYRLLRSPIGERGRILVTQPRTITLRQEPDSKEATTTPGYIASKLMGQPAPWVGQGQEIGFRFSKEREMYDAYTRLLFVTDGTLINWIRSGEVGAFDVVMIDEAHEQSVNMELIFALLKYRMSLYPHMRLVIASATVDVDKFAAYFGNGDPEQVFVAAPGNARALAAKTPKHIHDRFMSGNAEPRLDFSFSVPDVLALAQAEPRERLKLVPRAVAALVKAIVTKPQFTCLRDSRGDILVFLPRVEQDMRPVAQAILDLRLGVEVYPCHAQLTEPEYSAFKRSEKRAQKSLERGEATSPQRVILATTYAETSVTMSNLRYVIDTGLILQPSWDPETCSTSYRPQWHSQDGCTQRKGRVGRVQDGECFRLYTKAEHDELERHTKPEITRVQLDKFLIAAKAAGIDDLDGFDWLGKETDPATSQWRELLRAKTVLRERGVVDSEGDITRRGLELSQFQTESVDLALCMSESDTFGCTLEMATFLAFVGLSRSPFKRGDSGAMGYLQWTHGCRDDLELYLRLYHRWSEYDGVRPVEDEFASKGVDPDHMYDVEDARDRLVAILSRNAHDSVTWRQLDLKRIHRVRLVLARCLPEWLYVRDSASAHYQPLAPQLCPYEGPIQVERDSAVAGTELPEAFICIGRTRVESRDAVFAKHLVRIEKDWLANVRTMSPVAVSVLLRDVPGESRDEAWTTAENVELVPQEVPLLNIKEGLRVTLTVVRTVVDNARDTAVLCRESQGTRFCIAQFEGYRIVQPGESFEAIVTRVRHGRATLSQKTVIEELAASPRVCVACVNGIVRHSEDGTPIGLYAEVKDIGARGRLMKGDMGYWERSNLLQSQVGCFIDVIVIGGHGEACNLSTVAVSEGRRKAFRENEEVVGTVVGRAEYGDHHAKAGDISGVQVELVPGVNGFLGIGEFGFNADEQLQKYREGKRINVVVRKPQGNGGRSELRLALPSTKFLAGDHVSGIVTYLAEDKTGHGPPFVSVELAPRVEGSLYWKNAPRGALSELVVGSRVRVRVIGPRSNGKSGYELGA